jgi:hypothetical protein
VLAVSPERAARLFQGARDRQLLVWPIGTVSARPGMRMLLPGGVTLEWSIDSLRAAAGDTLRRIWNEDMP